MAAKAMPQAASLLDPDQCSEDSLSAPFFAVSTAKLLVLSVCTFGLYEVYWFYENWRRIKLREGSQIAPAVRAVFSIFFCYPCFARIRDFSVSAPLRSGLTAWPLAMGWIVTTLFCELGGPYWFVSLFGVIFLLPVQSHVNRINAAVCPRHDPNSRLTLVNGVAIGIGLVLLVVTAVGIGAT